MRAATLLTNLGPESSEGDFQAFVDASVQHPQKDRLLLALLEEAASVYRGRGARSVTRMRGYVLAALGRHGTPRAALSFVLAELEGSREPYSVAAAARAVRGLTRPPAAVVPYLLRGLSNVQLRDDALTFERYCSRGYEPQYTSAVGEIVATLVWLDQAVRPWLEELRQLLRRADSPLAAEARSALAQLVAQNESASLEEAPCCRPLSALVSETWVRWPWTGMGAVQAVDQEGAVVRLAQHCRGRVSLVAFFYTRCDNPNKCSLTVARLAELQRQLRQLPWSEGVQLLGISYDPGHDAPALLKTYGVNRGFCFGIRDRFLRTRVEDWPAVEQFFRLGVNYAGSIVNQHAVELYLLDERARPIHSFKRLRWSDEEVLELTRQAVEQQHGPQPMRWLRRCLGAASPVALSLAIVFFPKCPVCWAAYLGVFGVMGASTLPYSPWLLPVLVVLLLVSLTLLVLGLRHKTSRSRLVGQFPHRDHR